MAISRRAATKFIIGVIEEKQGAHKVSLDDSLADVGIDGPVANEGFAAYINSLQWRGVLIQPADAVDWKTVGDVVNTVILSAT